MAKPNAAERLDEAVESFLSGSRTPAPSPAADPRLELLLRVASALRGLPRESFRARLKDELVREGSEPEAPGPGHHQTMTLYLTVREARELVEFVQRAFDAQVRLQTTGSAGGLHAEVVIGNSVVMIGGGGALRGTPMPASIHLYVPDADAAYRRALAAGAISTHEPVDQSYGDREAGVRDLAGNNWYIATHRRAGGAGGASPIPPGLRSVTPYFHPRGSAAYIAFLERALGAREVERATSPDGTVVHAKVAIGDSILELGEAHGKYQPVPAAIYLSVADADALYRRAVAAGAVSVSEPADQPYGARVGSVKDPADNLWYIAAPIPRAG